MSTSSAGEALAPLPRGMACWRLAKLPQAELKQRLDAFQLQTDGTKRTLAARLHTHLASLPTPDPSSSSADEADKRDGQGVGEDAGTRSRRRHRTRAQAQRGPGGDLFSWAQLSRDPRLWGRAMRAVHLTFWPRRRGSAIMAKL